VLDSVSKETTLQLHEIMSATDTSFTPEDSLIDVLQSLAEKSHTCKVLCVDGKPKGILTEHDMVRLFAKHEGGGLPQGLKAGDVMTKDLITFTTDLELAEATLLFRSKNLRHLPVVDGDGALVGIITLQGMVKAYQALSDEHNKLEELSEELQCQSLEDTLTGLPNRRAMEADLHHAEAVAHRRAESYAIGLIDIDLFKPYNDFYGHPAGDEALRKFGQIVRRCMRASDKIFRYGGEEFLYFMPSTTAKNAEIAADRLRKAVSEANLEHSKSPLGHVTISIGIAVSGNDGWQAVIDKADAALYQAKSRGRNTISISEEEQQLALASVSSL